MPISFNCVSCKKKVKAPDKAGGRWGSCPHCNVKCYIPMPPAPEEEELKLIPLEEGEEESYEKKMAESRNLQLDILHQTDGGNNQGGGPFNEQDKKQLWKNIITYLRLMADGELDQAHETAGGIVRYGDRAKEIIAEIARAETPEPELADIPDAILKGLIKNLISEINDN